MFKNKYHIEGPIDCSVPVKLNFGEYILQRLLSFKDNICWINAATGDETSYGSIVQHSMNLAVSLIKLGVGKGQTVAICSENTSEFWSVVIGGVCTGAAVTPINMGYSKGELQHVINISKPSIIFCSPTSYKLHQKTLRSIQFIKHIVVFGSERHHATLLYNDLVLPNEQVKNVIYEEFKVADVMGQVDTLLILYSSGTTGLPKGVMLTHLNLLAACSLPTSVNAPAQLSVTISPWYHSMGLCGSLTGMVTGRTAVYMAKFEIDLYLKSIEKYKAVHLGVVPPILVALSKLDLKYDFSSVKVIYSGAAPLHKDVLDSLKAKFPHIVFLQGYGMTEATLGVIRDSYDETLTKPGGVGRVVAGTIVKVVDVKTRQPLGANQTGEICVKGPLLMKGYVGKDSKDVFDEEGFYKSGDIGYYDDDRCFFIVDRMKELIKYKAYQVPPAEIEAVLLQHESIKDAGVVGKEDRVAGEVPVAFVVVQPGRTVTEDEVKKFVAERLSNPKHLRGGVRFVDQIPKNPSGKILRKDLKAMLKKGRSKL